MTYPDEYQHETYPLHIESADERPRKASPEGWYPTVADLMVDEDELELMPAGVWFRYFDGGRNGIHFVMRDDDGSFYHIDGVFGPYELSSPNVNGGYPNAYDGFWTAEQRPGKCRTDDIPPPG